MYKERPFDQWVDLLGNNILGGWVITVLSLSMLQDSYAGAPHQKILVFEPLRDFSQLWCFTFDSSYACALQTSPPSF